MSKTLVDHLEVLYPTAKRTTFREMIAAGRVSINGKPARTLKQPIQESDAIRVSDRSENSSHARRDRAAALPFPIVYEDEHLLVIDKPSGLLTSTVPREKRATALKMIWDYARSKDKNAQVGLIHRLDRDASGLLVFSKNHDAYLSLKRQFFEHTVERIYLALVAGTPNPRAGTIDSYVVERADGSVHSTSEPRKKAEHAITHYETSETSGKRSLIRVKLGTGKKHQIRTHLSERGVPIINDSIYSKTKAVGRLMLAAVELKFVHPATEKIMHFKIDPPEGFEI